MTLPHIDYKDLGGTVRSRSAEETLSRVNPMLKYFGISRVSFIHGMDNIGIPVSVAIRPRGKMFSTSQGKGNTPVLAEVSAIMESIEMWHAENLEPAACFSNYSALVSRNNVIAPYLLNPQPWLISRVSENDTMEWLECIELNSKQKYFLPRTFIDMDSTGFITDSTKYFYSTSNGLASGNDLDEAILHGLFELIERDAKEKFVRNLQMRKTSINLSTIASPYVVELLQKISSANLNLQIFNMTSDVEIPTFFATLAEPETMVPRCALGIGMGTHAFPEVAISRAISEAVQTRLTKITGTRDDILPHRYKLDKINASNPSPFQDTKASEDFNQSKNILGPQNTSKQMLNQLLIHLKSRGIDQVFVYNHTRPEFGLSVAHVVCPKLLNVNEKPKAKDTK
jgi:YcaO-like protein with predicted kinase domain